MALASVKHQSSETYFEVSSTRAARVLRISVVGDLDMATTPYLRSSVASLLLCGPTAPTEVEIDLSGVSFMGACGFRAIDEIRRTSEYLGLDFVIVNPSRAVVRLLEILDREDLAERAMDRLPTGVLSA
jgi:anti-anti-sigma factor